jgi:hypothetical protein
MEPIHQRLVAAWHLDPLGPEETIEYVRHRLERAGWNGHPGFAPGVLTLVYEFSEGIPRRINLICSRLLLSGFLGESHTITAEDAQAVMQELRDAELAPPQGAGSEHAWPLPEERSGADEATATSRDRRTARRADHEPRAAGGSV